MDGRIIVSLIFLCLFLIFCILGIKQRIDEKKIRRKEIHEAYGKKRKIKNTKVNIYNHHLKTDDSRFFIDEITASDTELDKIFGILDHTRSSSGREYLYYSLRYILLDKELIKRRGEDISIFGKDEALRENIQEKLVLLGSNNNANLYEYLESQSLPGSFLIRELVPILLYLISTVAIVVNTGVGICLFIFSIFYSVWSYFIAKTKTGSFIDNAFYIIRLLDTAKRIKAIYNIDNHINQTLSSQINNLSGVKIGTKYVFLSADSNKNIFSMITDYINMLFHFDLIIFAFVEKKIKAVKEDIYKLSDIIGYIDACIAIGSFRKTLDSWCEPDLNAGAGMVKGLYHPMLNKPVKNDYYIERQTLITGSNASGKSTYLKSAALAIIMAQGMNTVCADEYKGDVYRPYTSMALKDNILNGESFFMAEIKSIKRILDDNSNNIIIFIDEILKGTNTTERIAASSSIAEYINKKGYKMTFATHDIELCSILEKNFTNVHFDEIIGDGDVEFTYRLNDGKASSRNAIRLLKQLDYNDELVLEADRKAKYFDDNGKWE